MDLEDYIARLPDFMRADGEDPDHETETPRDARGNVLPLKHKKQVRETVSSAEHTARFLRDEVSSRGTRYPAKTDVGMLPLAEGCTSPWPGGFWTHYIRDYRTTPDELALRDASAVEMRRKGYTRAEDPTSEDPTSAKPVVLHLGGYDDCSYEAYFATVEEAQETLALIQTAPLEPKDLRDLHFVFTN